ncbi:hypothetical protein GCM10009819_29590 [Agromyces tropicus]|uniref:Uncharacterized protein n=1 Tax=Agromyces tropicus TaxID=555371 RepID=A0ABN2UWC8_9MICO
MTTLQAGISSTALWPADWSQFIPDLLSSAAIGAAVGLVIYLWEQRSQRKQAQALAIASWRVARSTVAVSMPDPAPNDPPTDPRHNDRFEAIAAAIDGLPVAVWADAAPSNAELSLARELAIELPIYAECGQRLVETVKIALVDAGHTSFFSPDTDYLVDATLRSRTPAGAAINDMTGPFIRALGGGDQTSKYDALNQTAREAAGYGPLQQAGMDFNAAYERIAGLYNDLRALLRPTLLREGTA